MTVADRHVICLEFADVLKSDLYDYGEESRGEGLDLPGSAFFSVIHHTASFLMACLNDFLYSPGVR